MSERSDIAAGKDRKDITIPRPYQKEIMLRIERTLEKKGTCLFPLPLGMDEQQQLLYLLIAYFMSAKLVGS